MEKSFMTVSLKGLRFFAYHGLFPEERKTGNWFEADLELSYVPPADPVCSLDDTPDYGAVYQLVGQTMKEPRDLLETLVMEIASLLKEKFPALKAVRIGIRKMQPPIPGFTGTAGVILEKEY